MNQYKKSMKFVDVNFTEEEWDALSSEQQQAEIAKVRGNAVCVIPKFKG